MKLIIKNESYSKVGELTDCFYSFFILNDELFSVHRRHKLFSFPHWPRNESENISRIVLTRYKNRSVKMPDHEEILCDGNDPRVVSTGTKAFVISQGAVHSNVSHYLTELPSKRRTEISLGNGTSPGKNWQPFTRGEDLYLVDSISPFRLNRLAIDTGEMVLERQAENDLALKADHDQYSILRGGSNALPLNGALYGWGHATVAEYRHVPYIWKFDGNSVTTCFTNIHGFFAAHGYNIVDPTCLFEWDEKHFALGLSCSQRDWFHPQWFLNALIIFKKKDLSNFAPFDFSDKDAKIKRKSLIYHAREMTTLIESREQHGGRCNDGRAGCLVCGPSNEIDTRRPWTVELCYSSPHGSGRHVGEFDILLTSEGREHQAANTRIFGTDGKSIRVRLNFESGSDKARIQTRVFTRKKHEVTAYFFELFND